MGNFLTTRGAWRHGSALVMAVAVLAMVPGTASTQSPQATFLENGPDGGDAPVSAGPSQRQPFDYAYVVATYSCVQSGREVAVFSQVFGACYLETGHSRIATDQRSTLTEIARAACGGEAVFSSQRSSYPHSGRSGEARAEDERSEDLREVARYRDRVESAYLQEPYSSRCQ